MQYRNGSARADVLKRSWLLCLFAAILLLVSGVAGAATCIQNGGSQVCHRPVVLWVGHYPAVYPYPSGGTSYVTVPYANPMMAENDVAAHAVQVDSNCSGEAVWYGVHFGFPNNCDNGVVQGDFSTWWVAGHDECIGTGCFYDEDNVTAPYSDPATGYIRFFVFGYDGQAAVGGGGYAGVYSVAGEFMVTPFYVCPAGDKQWAELPNGQQTQSSPANEWCVASVRAGAASWYAADRPLDLRDGTDGHQDGLPCSCQPVDPLTQQVVDVKVDYRNHAPFPIVWQRTYAPTSPGGWHFNYDLKVDVSAPPGTATVASEVSRPNGTTLVFTGTLQSDGTYTWTPTLPGPWTSLESQIASKFSSTSTGSGANAAWTGFTLVNYRDETESYDAKGLFTTLEDRQGYQLHFSYDTKDRLSGVDDDFGHHLTVQHTDNAYSASFTWNDWSTGDPGNTAGGTTTTSGTAWPSPADQAREGLVTGVMDGTESVTYGYTLNPTASGGVSGGAWQLTSITAPDGGVRALKYAEPMTLAVNPDGTATVSPASYTPAWWLLSGVIDENNSRYRTFIVGGGVTGEVTGGTLEPLQYSGYSLVPGNSAAVNVNFSAANSADQIGRTYATTNSGGNQMRCPDWLCAPDFIDWRSATYDATGHANLLANFAGVTQSRVTDPASDEVASVTEAANMPAFTRTTTTSWDTRFRLPDSRSLPIASSFPSGQVSAGGTLGVAWTWDGSARLTALSLSPSTGEAARGWSFGYDGVGLPTTMATPSTNLSGGSPWTLAWNDTSGTLASRTDPLGHVTTYGAYTPEGLAGSVTDPNGLVTTVGHDARGRVTAVDRGGETTQYVYQASGSGLLDHVVRPDGVSFHFTWNAAHWLTQVQEQGSDGSVLGTLALGYTPMGQVASTTLTDGAGNVVGQQAAGYDPLYRLTSTTGAQANEVTSRVLDALGRTTAATNPDAATTHQAFDALGRVSSVTDGLGKTTAFGYDPQDDVTSITDSRGNVTHYGYDAYGDLLSVSSPDAGTTGFGYDAAGRRVSRTDARGVTTAWTWDALDRPLTETLDSTGVAGSPAGLVKRQEARTFGYDTCTDGVGRLCAVTEAAGSEAWTYDTWGRVTSDTFTPTGAGFGLAVSYAYNGQGQQVGITYPSGHMLGLTYSADGQVSGLTWNGTAVLSGALHQPFDGPVLGWTWGASTTGGVSFRYDADGRVTALGDNGPSDEHDYTWSPGSLLTGLSVPGQPAWDATWLHDADGRITQASLTGVVFGYGYDFNGNRTVRSYTATDTLTTPLASNRLASLALAGGSPAARVYDPAGDLVDDGLGSLYAYGPDGRLEQADTPNGSESLAYDFQGHLRARQVFTGPNPGLTYRAYDTQGRLLGIYSASGTALEELVWLDDRLVATVRQGAVYPILTTPNGTPRQVLDPATGQALWTWETPEPFGDTPPQSPSGFVFTARFPGQWYDDVTHLAFNGFRDYDPQTGRYLEPDPTGLAAGPNPYTYVDGDPMDYTDPYGLWAWGDTLPQGLVDFSAGMGDTLSFGLTNMVRNAMGTNDVVNKCSGSYLGGEVAGAALDVGIGGAAGLEAAGERGAGREFSHWIPNRMGGPRSLWNGNYVPRDVHALSDPFRYRFMPRAWKSLNPMPGAAWRQWTRLPNIYKGIGAGIAAGVTGTLSNGKCGCEQ